MACGGCSFLTARACKDQAGALRDLALPSSGESLRRLWLWDNWLLFVSTEWLMGRVVLGMIGLGTVGSGVVRLLAADRQLILKKVAVRDPKRPRQVEPS